MSEKLSDKRAADWKFFGLRHGAFKLWLAGSFFLLALPVFVWMYRNYYFINPFVPSDSGLRNSDLYGRNVEGGLTAVGALFLIENLFALAVLMPFSFSRYYWSRLLILQCLYGFWSFILLMTAMHSNSLYIINLIGVLGIDLLIFGWLILTFIAEMHNRTAAR